MDLSRRQFIGGLTAAAVTSRLAWAAEKPGRKPNIPLIVAEAAANKKAAHDA
jgi:hypothetical protein